MEAGMGKLVPFEKGRRLVRARLAAPPEGQVVIFTGVRYQRGVPVLPDDGRTPERPKRKRG
jgi:hypothetical protein